MNWEKKRFAILLIIQGLVIFNLRAEETIRVDFRTGSTLSEAAERVNVRKEAGSTRIIVTPGVHNLTRTVLFEPEIPYSKDERLVIEAQILPDDPQWKPRLMPVILYTGVPDEWGKTDDVIELSGLKIETGHVTLRGLKFLGCPVPGVWYYPVFREGKDLDDLVVTQCLFAVENYGVTANVGVLANGHGLVLDHCVFINCRNPAVFWRVEGGTSRGCAMRYCIVDGGYTSGVWTCDTGEDFQFHNNILTRCEYAWMRPEDNKRTYRMADCVITDFSLFSGVCRPGFETGPAGPDITYEKSNVAMAGDVQLEKEGGIDAQVASTFLHPAPGTLGSDLGAGLFLDLEKRRFTRRTFTYKTVDSLEILADAYVPSLAKGAPVVIYIHGGGLIFGCRHNLCESLRDELMKAGYALVSIDFRLAPETRIEEIIEDVADACRWIRENGAEKLSVDPRRMALIGGSSGGYLALIAGRLLEPRPRALISVSGLGDLELLRKHHNPDRTGFKRDEGPYAVVKDEPLCGSEDPARLKLGQYLVEKGWLLYETLGFDPDEEPERYDRLSLIKDIPAGYPPVLLVHAESDPSVPFDEAAKVMHALKEKGIDCKLFVVPEGHSSELLEKNPKALRQILSFLDEHLK